jgi:hypothetical protein
MRGIAKDLDVILDLQTSRAHREAVLLLLRPSYSQPIQSIHHLCILRLNVTGCSIQVQPCRMTLVSTFTPLPAHGGVTAEIGL